MSTPNIIGSGFIKEISWDMATIVIVDKEGKEHENAYRLATWEWYAAREEPTFDVTETIVTGDQVDPEVAAAFNLSTAENPDGDGEYRIFDLNWRADYESYRQYIREGDDSALDSIIIEEQPLGFGEDEDESHAIDLSEYHNLENDGRSIAASRAAHGPIPLDAEGNCDNLDCGICYDQDLLDPDQNDD